MKRNNLESCQIVIFGGTGDLTHRKLMPAFYNLLAKGSLPNNFSIISIGKGNKDRQDYLDDIYQSLQKFVNDKLQDEFWNSLKEKIYYENFDFEDKKRYQNLKEELERLDNEYQTHNKRIFYLAVPPRYFGIIVDNLEEASLLNPLEPSWPRVVIEKPFGYDLESAKRLNKQITKVFPEENIYRIDHYLGKEMLQSMMMIRFANLVFEPVWNNKYIDNIQIISNETVGVGKRGRYYEKSGALRDMVQNHMLQILALTAMEPPTDMKTESVRDEKIKVFKSLANFDSKMIADYVVRGQYDTGTVDNEEVIAYRDEDDVAADSKTETFVALKLLINNMRWSGVPFYIKTGKRLNEKFTEVIIEFKSSFHPSYSKRFIDLKPNLLAIKIQPDEGVYFQFNAKELDSKENIVPVKMNFCQNCGIEINSPEAYERLMHSVMIGDQTLFTRWDEVEYSWKFVDQISEAWTKKDVNFPNYQAGSDGPQAAHDLLAKDELKWWGV
ncbi:glucose-6-phosphate dehydrogenase [Selenihalanaerobacter shriftii]|uniref:Glucose-6-phosphate 1-dehydrogenase n=1 Tax=Selenihalanaerobacter shriftii TaxID=142842 RepID=A0A1T4KDE2_9FIRM|nr:glucose-6-phosphate dehydrogenase [Selenihalanaerobacter shriftii]SJZ40454.1 glucose-6-phosphate 1-dehydrogenase [Selenihalanaerobacter shriftii]